MVGEGSPIVRSYLPRVRALLRESGLDVSAPSDRAAVRGLIREHVGVGKPCELAALVAENPEWPYLAAGMYEIPAQLVCAADFLDILLRQNILELLMAEAGTYDAADGSRPDPGRIRIPRRRPR
jgi:hypothetical protein